MRCCRSERPETAENDLVTRLRRYVLNTGDLDLVGKLEGAETAPPETVRAASSPPCGLRRRRVAPGAGRAGAIASDGRPSAIASACGHRVAAKAGCARAST